MKINNVLACVNNIIHGFIYCGALTFNTHPSLCYSWEETIVVQIVLIALKKNKRLRYRISAHTRFQIFSFIISVNVLRSKSQMVLTHLRNRNEFFFFPSVDSCLSSNNSRSLVCGCWTRVKPI